MEYIIFYFIVGFVFLIGNTIVGGYFGKNYTLEDIKDSILWPLSFSILLGLVIRILIDKYKTYKIKPKIKGK
jgi:hypothetical protein